MSDLPTRNLFGEIKTIRVFDRKIAEFTTVQVIALTFMMETEGVLTHTQGVGTMSDHFSMPDVLAGYFTQLGAVHVLWCTWKEQSIGVRPTAITFNGELLMLS